MSEYTRVRPRIKVKSLEDIKTRLGLRELTLSEVYLSCDERIDTLGNVISSYMKDIQAKSKAVFLEDIKDHEVFQNASKVASLSQSLSENRFSILRELTERNMNSGQRKTVDKIREFMISNNIKGLSYMSREISTALGDITQAVKKAHTDMANTERDIVKEKMISVLSGEGYDVSLKTKQTELLLRGKHKDLSIVVSLGCSGAVEIDLAGFEGSTCATQLTKLKQGLRNEGIELEVIETVHHGKRDGGSLIKKLKHDEHAWTPLEESSPQKTSGSQRMLHLYQHMKQRIKR